MAKQINVRDAMIAAADALIRQRGAAASGMQDIVAEAAAPRGSIYHHFPGGKDELVIAALERVTTMVEQAIAAIGAKSGSADAFVLGVATVFRTGAEQAGWTLGCPIAAVATEGDRQSPAVREAVAEGFARWQRALAEGLRHHPGTDDPDARALMILSAIEGGLLLSRGLRSPAPYDAAVALLQLAFQQASRGHSRTD